ncbi:MAG: corrinoid protein-associated methyltransferase CpaM [bacterium]
MSSYIYMKLLESQPDRYDRGLAWLSLGRSERIKEKLTEENVKEGSRVLEIGVGTGTMAILAARRGASVLGFDISSAMLSIAADKIEREGLGDRVELKEMGVSGMDRLPAERFDLVSSTLVFSELSADEQSYALSHSYRALKPGGSLALACEARPRSAWNRLLHTLIRIPLLVITFIFTQTTTHAVDGLEERVEAAGFKLEKAERSGLDNFLYLVARKEK